MTNPDEIYKKLDRRLVGWANSMGEAENAFFQHVGKIYNKQIPYSGKLADEIVSNVNRILTRQKKHGFEQNKKTDLEKLIEKGENNE